MSDKVAAAGHDVVHIAAPDYSTNGTARSKTLLQAIDGGAAVGSDTR
jgi:hypothetical protein